MDVKMKIKKGRFFLALVILILSVQIVIAATPDPNKEIIPGVKRGDTIIIEDPSGRIMNPGTFNLWAAWAGGKGGFSTGLQQLGLDTLWYQDPDAGLKGSWQNSLAMEKPVYNKDFTKMTVKLRKGIFWSDGVEFTADDVVYTVDTLKANPTLLNAAVFVLFVKSMETPDKYTVVFNLTKPNSRFHRTFTVRWNATWIMPKHVWEKAVLKPTDAMAYTFNPPVTIGAYKLKDYDKQGDWYIWERRDDWKRTTIAEFGMPAPKYAMYVNAGSSDKKVFAQLNHELDMVHEVTPEGIIKLAENSWEKNWFNGFPWGHPDPTLVALLINNAREPFDNRDVRWALTLSLDIVKASMASYKGAVTLSPIHFPPTGGSRAWYFDPLQSWLKSFEIDTGKGKIKPYDTTIAIKIADEARKLFGNAVPADPERIRSIIGLGWWKYDPDAAAALLEKNGFTKKKNLWYKPNGEQFKIELINMGVSNPTLARLGTMIAELWTQFGIETNAITAVDSNERHNVGNFDVQLFWNIESLGGNPDVGYFTDTWHSDFYTPIGQVSKGRNYIRYKSTELDKIINEISKTPFDSKKNAELGIRFLKLTTNDMPTIPLMSYNVFSSQDNTFWEGYPDFDRPYANPVTNWGNSRTILTQLKQKLPPTK